jgi:DNA-binding response OmpR family regulator
MSDRPSGGRRVGVLVVDSDFVVRHLLAEYLRECGFRVFEAVDSDEALACLQNTGLDVEIALVALDCKGSMDGFALSRWVKANRPEMRVAIAGSAAKATEKAAEICEDGPHLQRPYEHRLVLDRIMQLIAARDRARGS